MVIPSNIGPYKWQRKRHRLGEYPRPPQPAIQPNQLPSPKGWGMNSRDYWNTVFSEYLKRRRG